MIRRFSNNMSSQVREIGNINKSILDEICESEFLGDHCFGFEKIIKHDNIKTNIIIPSTIRIDEGNSIRINHSILKQQSQNLSCYEAILIKPSFLPLYSNEGQDLLNKLDELQTELNQHDSVFVQILFSRLDEKYKDQIITMYRDYLHGNDYPFENKILRSFQDKIIQFIEKPKVKKKIPEVNSKILSKCFKFEMRFVITVDEKTNDLITYVINELFKKYDFWNGLRLIKVRDKPCIEKILNRKITKFQYLSRGEINGLLLSGHKSTPTTTTTERVMTESRVQTETNEKVFDLLPIGQKKDREIDYKIVDTLESALKRIGVIKKQKLKTKNIQLGSTLQKITIDIPNGINFSDIQKQHKNIKVTLGINSLGIEQGDEPGTISFVIPCEEREAVYLSELMDDKFREFANENELPFIIGVDEIGNPIYECLSRVKNLLVAGAIGSGKSVWLNQLILTLLLMRNSSEMMMYLIDPKKVELLQFKGFPQVHRVVTNMGEANDILSSLVNEMENRYDFLSEQGYKNILSYNKSHPENKKPYIVFLIDEYADLQLQYPNVEDNIQKLSQKARAAGIYLILATQRPDTKIVSGVIKANLPSVISFRLKNNNDYRTVFGTGQPYQLLGQGDGVMKLEGQIQEFRRFQGATICLDEDEEQEVYEKIKNSFNDESVDGIEIVKSRNEEPIDKLKRIIAETGETRIAKLQKEMKVRINTVHELMAELVDEGWLEKPKSKTKGYQLIADESELEKWRD